MKKKIDIFWYWFLIIVAFVICFMFSSVKANAAISSGGSTGNDNTVVLPDDGIFEPCVSETGCNLTDEAIEQVNLYEECHTYITTNIISNESLLEALNGKIYTTFTQEDCMEMIDIASKREVIKNMLNFYDYEESTAVGMTYSFKNNVLTLNGTTTGVFTKRINLVTNLSLDGVYTLTGTNSNISNNSFFTLNVGETDSTLQLNYGYNKKDTETIQNLNIICLHIWMGAGVTYNNFQISFQLEKGSTATPYVSYDYHREYYKEGITDADNRVNTTSESFLSGYDVGLQHGYKRATNDGKSLGTFIPNLLGGIGSFFLTILNIDILGFNLLTLLGIFITILGIVVVIKFLKG